jgi:UDPglucose 6-dehydrogenase
MTARALAESHGTEAGLVEAWLSDSRYRREWVLRQLHALVLSVTTEPVIAIWGLAYKAGTASTKNSPALALLEALRPFCVRVYDPVVSLNGAGGPKTLQTAGALEACRGADALAILAPWTEFSEVSLTQVQALMRGRVLIDPFGVLDHMSCLEFGWRHVRLGAPAPCEPVATVPQGGAT